jgi:hypothetical protein
MGDKFIFTKNKGKNQLNDCRAGPAQRLWNALIPNCNGLVANPCPAKSRIIPNRRRKSKKAKGKRADELKPRFSPLPFSSASS